MALMRSGTVKLCDAVSASSTGAAVEVFSPDQSGILLIDADTSSGALNLKVDIQGSFDKTTWVTIYRVTTADEEGGDDDTIAKVIAVMPFMRVLTLSGAPAATTVWLQP